MCEDCEKYKQKINELTFQINKLQSQIKLLQSKINSYNTTSNTNHNTSSEFPLPSEIKQIWEYIAQFSMFDFFEEIINDNKTKACLITKQFIKYIENYASTQIENKVKDIQKILNNEHTITYNDFYKQISFLLKSNFKTTFINTCDIKNIMDQFSLGNCNNIKTVKEFISLLCKICFYMKLHNPPLSFYYEDSGYDNNIHFLKSKHHCIDGFTQEGNMCHVLLPFPTNKDNYNYLNVKSIVIELNNIDTNNTNINTITNTSSASNIRNESSSSRHPYINGIFKQINNGLSFSKSNSTVVLYNHKKVNNMKQKSSEVKTKFKCIFRDNNTLKEGIKRNIKHGHINNTIYNQFLCFTNMSNNDRSNTVHSHNTIAKFKERKSTNTSKSNLIYDDSNKENVNWKVSFQSTVKLTNKIYPRRCNVTYRRSSIGNKLTYIPIGTNTVNKIKNNNYFVNNSCSNQPNKSYSKKKLECF